MLEHRRAFLVVKFTFELGALNGEAYFGKAQEDQAEDGLGVFLGLEAGIGTELVGCILQTLFERRGGSAFFGEGDPKLP